MSTPRPYQVYLYVGHSPQQVEGARVVDITPDAATCEAMSARITGSGLTSADLRSRAVFVVDPSADADTTLKALLAYVAMLGLARRRLDVAFGFDSPPVVMADLDLVARQMADTGKPSEPAAMLHLVDAECTCDADHLALGSRLGIDEVTRVRFSKRVLYTSPPAVAVALPQFIAVASIRARGEAERLPMLDAPEVLDLESVRKLAEGLRRQLRGDNRSAVVERVPAAPYLVRMDEAAACDMAAVLEALGGRSRMVEVAVKDADGNPTGETTTSTVWHCLHPENHVHGDASPSARVTQVDNRFFYRCFKCLPERVDPLRLVMWARGCSPDEAADWILANAAH